MQPRFLRSFRTAPCFFQVKGRYVSNAAFRNGASFLRPTTILYEAMYYTRLACRGPKTPFSHNEHSKDKTDCSRAENITNACVVPLSYPSLKSSLEPTMVYGKNTTFAATSTTFRNWNTRQRMGNSSNTLRTQTAVLTEGDGSDRGKRRGEGAGGGGAGNSRQKQFSEFCSVNEQPSTTHEWCGTAP